MRLRILLLGNYIPDAQESMLRYAELMRTGLLEAGHQVSLIAPRIVLNQVAHPPTGIWKWIGYADKYVLGVPELQRVGQSADVLHICDHANSIYVPARSTLPCIVTCHDLLAVRGGLGEDTDCPAGFTGVRLQKAILRGLARAQAVACASNATRRDAERLLPGFAGSLSVVHPALNFPYRELDAVTVRGRLSQVEALRGHDSYVLHIGSNLRRKNRECALRAMSTIGADWNGKLVFAGQPLTRELRRLAAQLGVTARIVEVEKPSSELLEALYNGALALLFPSRFEGFGWPIVEAQACGCPVICSDRAPFPEVSGEAAIMCDADDHVGFANAIISLAQRPERRAELRRRGLENSTLYGRQQMIARFTHLYRQLMARNSPDAAVA
jgi:glycosyltransferase involved in cell wall biosynthesis